MVSKQAEKSIKQYRRFAKLLSILYRSPNEMTKWRIKLFRWFVDLQGTFGPKVKGTVKEEFNFNGVNTWKISTPNSNPDRVLLYFHGGAYSLGSPKSHYSLVSYLADITKTTVYVPDYRLGPESKYPAQLETWTHGRQLRRYDVAITPRHRRRQPSRLKGAIWHQCSLF